MAVPTTTCPGPTSTELDDLDKAIESHPIWTELRGPVSNIRGSSLTVQRRAVRLNEIRGNDFSTADLRELGFQGGVDLSLQRLPTAPGYVFVPDAPAALAAVRAEVTRWAPLTLRKSVLQFVEQYQFYVAGGQRQILIHPEGFFKEQREAAAVFADLLRAHGGQNPSAR
jgi:hypothetical protein